MYSVSSYSFDVPTPGCNYCKAVYYLFCFVISSVDLTIFNIDNNLSYGRASNHP